MLLAMRKDLATNALFDGTPTCAWTATSSRATPPSSRTRSTRELSAAVALYGGPFLDGFTLPDAPGSSAGATASGCASSQRFRGALESLT